jgi:hypothetical protein
MPHRTFRAGLGALLAGKWRGYYGEGYVSSPSMLVLSQLLWMKVVNVKHRLLTCLFVARIVGFKPLM